MHWMEFLAWGKGYVQLLYDILIEILSRKTKSNRNII